MKKIICLIVIMCALYSCVQPNKNNIYVTNYPDDISIMKSPKEPESIKNQQPFLAFGKIEQIAFPDSLKVEQNLISQMTAYNSALMHGDIKTCYSYMYPDALEYCKKYYRGLSDIEVFEQMMKEFSGDLQETVALYEENGIELKLVIPRLLRKIQYGNDIIIVFNIATNICSENVYTYFEEMGVELGVSQNGGVNWYFLTKNEDTPTILKMHYSQDVVNKVMGYSF